MTAHWNASTLSVYGTAVLCSLILLHPAPSQAFPRDKDWWTIKTEHFEIHYHDGIYEIAERAAGILERAYARISSWLDWRTDSKIQVVLSDETDSSNGSARVIPYNLVTAFLAPPQEDSTLNDASDWLQVLLVHELTHILHMDQVRGAPAVINRIFGKVLAPNGAEPRWLIEGLAVLSESALTDGGRLRNSIFDMMIRTAALEDRLPPPDRLSGPATTWPGYTSAYLFGSNLMLQLAYDYGMGAVSEMAARYSARLVPFSLNITLRRTTGISWLDLYERWRRTAREEAQKWAKGGNTGKEPTRLTFRGWAVRWPRFGPDKRSMVYIARGPGDDTVIVLRDAISKRERILVRTRGAAGADFTPDGTGLVFCQRERYHNDYTFNDLYYLDLETGRQRRLTTALRVSRPDVSPDGQKIALTMLARSRRDIVVFDLRTGKLENLTKNLDVQSCDAPRWSPDGRYIVFSAWKKTGARNIMMMDIGSGEIQSLTAARSNDIDPVFMPDGSRIVFASDRDKTYNLYSYDLDDGTLTKLTDLFGGAFAPEPSPGGDVLVFVGYTSDGYDLFEVQPEGIELPMEPEPSARPILQKPQKNEVEISAPEPYSPWPSILPKAWVPVIVADSDRQELGLFLTGRDALARHFWAADLSYTFGGTGWNANATYVYSGMYPTLSFNAWYNHTMNAMGGLARDGRYLPHEQHSMGGSVYVSLPLFKYWSHHTLLTGFEAAWRIRKAPRQSGFDPAELQPRYPKDEKATRLVLGYYYSDTRSYALTPGPARGQRIQARTSIYFPELGSDYRRATGTIQYSNYLKLGKTNQVLALKLSLGMATGDPGRTPRYYLGGVTEQDLFQALLLGQRLPSTVLRGFEPGSVSTNRFVLVNIEHRFPLAFPEKGLSTLPMYLGRVHGAVFLDMAEAGSKGFDARNMLFGTGMEIRLDTTLGYFLPFTWRLGLAHGFGRLGDTRYYFGIGSIF